MSGTSMDGVDASVIKSNGKDSYTIESFDKKNRGTLITLNIKKDAELTYNYGYPFDSDFEEHICKCGFKKCVGYILSDDDWSKLKKELKKKK